jgi:predicted NUDIX family NTP pyrophosphohydrolase
MSARRSSRSAGLLLYRQAPSSLEFFLAHPGGPFWERRDDGAWTVPKGEVGEGEDLLDAARREFSEETGITPSPPFHALGSVRQKSGKVVHAWAWAGDADPLQVRSNSTEMEWPRGSGRTIRFPEVDRCAWFAEPEARRKLHEAQRPFIDRLLVHLANGDRP